MLSPHGKMSEFQRAQMYSLTDDNIHNIAIDGMFDDCQDIVKALQQDAEFKAAYNLGTVNSLRKSFITLKPILPLRRATMKKSALASHQVTLVIFAPVILPAKWDCQLTV